jgi:hypothetical protein
MDKTDPLRTQATMLMETWFKHDQHPLHEVTKDGQTVEAGSGAFIMRRYASFWVLPILGAQDRNGQTTVLAGC